MRENYEETVNNILKDTLNNKLKWSILRQSSVYRAYVSTIKITDKKKLDIVLNSFLEGNSLSNISFYLVIETNRTKIKDIGSLWRMKATALLDCKLSILRDMKPKK
jgi:hypothetical protein